MATGIISAMAPNCSTPSLHGSSSRLSRASGATPPRQLEKKDVLHGTLFTEEELEALMSGDCELLSSSENGLRSPLVSLQLQAQLLCRGEDKAQFQEPPSPLPLSLLDDLEEPISDEDADCLLELFSEEEIQALGLNQQFPGPRSEDHKAGKKRKSSPPWPSCVEDDDEEEAHLPPPPPPPPPPAKKAKKKGRSRLEEAARLRTWHNEIATRILRRRFRAPELYRGRTALSCQCPELALAVADPRGFVCCALHQDASPADREWMHSAQGHVPLVGGPGEVLVPTVSAGNSSATVLRYARWRNVSMPTRFYMQRVVDAEQGPAQAQQPDDDWMMSEY